MATKEFLMNYIRSKLDEINFEQNSKYPKNEIGLAQLFCDLYQVKIRYVTGRSQWFYYDGRRWCLDTGQLKVMEYCKEFAIQLIDYSMDIIIKINSTRQQDNRSKEKKIFGKR